MPCWVVPSVAAEIWGVPLFDVTSRIERGELASKSEAGFVFVDVMPNSPSPVAQASAPVEPPPTFTPIEPAADVAAPGPAEPTTDATTPVTPPRTYTVVTGAELAALTEPAPQTFVSVELGAAIAAETSGDGPHDFVDEETPGFSAKDWRRVRAQTARTRRPPGSSTLAA